MSTLILLSRNFIQKAVDKLVEKTGKQPSEIKFAFIEDAADTHPVEKRGFVEELKQEIISIGFKPENLVLKDFIDKPEELKSKLSEFEAVYFAGGSSFYLLYLFNKTGLIEYYKELLDNGLIHIGSSAGAMMCCPDIQYADIIDNPDLSPEKFTKALNLFPYFIFPHYADKEKYTKGYETTFKKYSDIAHKIIPLSNNQGIFVEGNNWEILQ